MKKFFLVGLVFSIEAQAQLQVVTEDDRFSALYKMMILEKMDKKCTFELSLRDNGTIEQFTMLDGDQEFCNQVERAAFKVSSFPKSNTQSSKITIFEDDLR